MLRGSKWRAERGGRRERGERMSPSQTGERGEPWEPRERRRGRDAPAGGQVSERVVLTRACERAGRLLRGDAVAEVKRSKMHRVGRRRTRALSRAIEPARVVDAGSRAHRGSTGHQSFSVRDGMRSV